MGHNVTSTLVNISVLVVLMMIATIELTTKTTIELINEASKGQAAAMQRHVQRQVNALKQQNLDFQEDKLRWQVLSSKLWENVWQSANGVGEQTALLKNPAIGTSLRWNKPAVVSAKPPFKLLVFITTHLSPVLLEYLKYCWPASVATNPLLRHADFLVYANWTKSNTPPPGLWTFADAGTGTVTAMPYE
jgi:hypothetical protein